MDTDNVSVVLDYYSSNVDIEVQPEESLDIPKCERIPQRLWLTKLV